MSSNRPKKVEEAVIGSAATNPSARENAAAIKKVAGDQGKKILDNAVNKVSKRADEVAEVNHAAKKAKTEKAAPSTPGLGRR